MKPSLASEDSGELTRRQTAELLVDAQRGDRRALSVLMERYHPRVLGMVRRKLGASLRSDHDSVDVAQDVLAETLRSLDGFQPRDQRSFSPWLWAIVENRIRNLRRNQGRQPRVVASEVSLRHVRDQDEGAEDWTGRRRRLEEEIEKMQGDQREVLKLRYEEQLSYREIAARMNRSEAAVSMLMSRARVALATALTNRERGA